MSQSTLEDQGHRNCAGARDPQAKDDDTKVLAYEMYRDAAAFEVHVNGPSLAQLRKEIAGMAKFHGVRCAVVDQSAD